MTFSSRSYADIVIRFSLAIFLSTLFLTRAVGQESVQQTSAQTEQPSEVSMSERVKQLESEVERQNSKLDQLQKTIAEQQLVLKALLEKLSDSKTSIVLASTTAQTSASNIPGATTTNVPATSTTSTQQTPTIEQRLAKVESAALRVGPIRVSGDFRLRFDGTFRSATDPRDPNVPHAQNVRARYRFRMNLDSDIYKTLSFHAQLATGAFNNGLSSDQDFGGVIARQPFAIAEAWIDYHPNRSVQLQGGRVQSIFADNSRFMFDDDTRFNGFNERYTKFLGKNAGYFSSVEFRAGQYILTNPNVAIIAAGSPLARTGEIVGNTGRSSNLFHQGILFNQQFNEKWSDQFGGDIQIFRNANQIALASTPDGAALLIQPGIGLALSAGLTGAGNAITAPGSVMYSVPGFKIVRLTYRLNFAGFKKGDHLFPVTLNIQGARNVATGMNERDAMLTALQIGRITKRGDTSYQYVFTIKGANSIISQLTDDDLGTGTGVNIRTHHFRFEYGISRKVTFQSLIFIQRQLRSSGQYPNFFVPLGAFVPTSYRVQQQIVFNF